MERKGQFIAHSSTHTRTRFSCLLHARACVIISAKEKNILYEFIHKESSLLHLQTNSSIHPWNTIYQHLPVEAAEELIRPLLGIALVGL